jgi:hypothetical protein
LALIAAQFLEKSKAFMQQQQFLDRKNRTSASADYRA